MSRLSRVLPANPLARRLSAQAILFATGDGAFTTGSAVFFTRIVGLSAAQVGLGLTIAGMVAFFVAVPLGRLSDRIGPKNVWALCAMAEAALYLVWPLISGFATFVAMVVLLQLFSTAGRAGRGAYTLDVFTREERVRSLAFMRSALNIGFTLGALIGGLALATDSNHVVRLVPLLSAAILLCNSVLIWRLPSARHETSDGPVELVARGALRNRGFVAMNLCNGILSSNFVLLTILIPLWLVQETDAPRVLLAYLFGTNTVLAVLLQVPASRGAETVSGALRASRISAVFFVASCLIVSVTHDTIGWTTIALVWLGHVTVTGSELFQSAGQWGLTAELSDPRRRGEYQGAMAVGSTLGTVWAPAAYTFLAINWGTPGWLLIASIVVAAAIGIHPAARAAERFLQQDEATPEPTAA